MYPVDVLSVVSTIQKNISKIIVFWGKWILFLYFFKGGEMLRNGETLMGCFPFPYAPWDWNMYLHLPWTIDLWCHWQKYSSPMEHLKIVFEKDLHMAHLKVVKPQRPLWRSRLKVYENLVDGFFQFANHVLESVLRRMIHLSRLECAGTLQQAPDDLPDFFTYVYIYHISLYVYIYIYIKNF